MPTNEEVINNLFQNSTKSTYWKTFEEISFKTQIPEQTIIEVINNSNNFFRSKSNTPGVFVVTTKELFRKYQSFGKKFLGALNNRIQ